MRTTIACLATTALLAGGCAIAPEGQGGKSVTHDVVDYLHREWPLAGPPVIPADACAAACACHGGGGCPNDPVHCGDDGVVYVDDWDQPSCDPHAFGWTDDPPPAVPLEPGPPGRFFPVPVRPAFAPQGPAEVGMGPIRAMEGTGL